MVKDSKAESLEARGLYRRAAARWMQVMLSSVNDAARERAKQRREHCLELAKRPPTKLDMFGDVHRAAKETQERMGIAQSKGEAFRNQNRFYFPK
ncbi:PerC family transcriptional regulator [Klebsiella pneumoniae]|uniref:PerC family transcriptional regulator n=1 Tax=Klebsiella pneumoniae TaxID=573 RepID=UPI00210976DC|nr:PerC family transcriptional regulator [Klebsiella pneumoniae]MCZ9547060.1 PerC family transcriptional regulator [Klebsiella pneumoniae]HBQ2180938.1 PerC family transcriptional regulator [Klebsiella pneumoniae]HCI6399789.1 PerC family transcriptional regulator [Klebsiella pneumoniae]HCU0768500.1 PerC family transcriptional regulator [Klebsiella michiganensis]